MSWINILRTSAEDLGTVAENEPPTEVLKDGSMKVGTACPAFFCTQDGNLKGLCHGDDFCVVARRKQLHIFGDLLENKASRVVCHRCQGHAAGILHSLRRQSRTLEWPARLMHQSKLTRNGHKRDWLLILWFRLWSLLWLWSLWLWLWWSVVVVVDVPVVVVVVTVVAVVVVVVVCDAGYQESLRMSTTTHTLNWQEQLN